MDKAATVLVRLTSAKPLEEMDTGERDYIETLILLIEGFERKRRDSALPKLTPNQRLKFLVEQRRMSVNDLGFVLGSQPTASLILSGTRGISKAHAQKLAAYFGVSPGLFIE